MSSTTSNKKKKQFKGSKLGRFLKVPIRLLGKARDFYVDSMNKCSAVAGYSTAMSLSDGQVGSGLPRSISLSSTMSRNDEDYRALVRVASLKHMSNKIESDLARRQGRMSPAKVTRSCSVGVGRIDEDKAWEFGEDDVKVKKDLFPRSRSYANSRRTRVF